MLQIWGPLAIRWYGLSYLASFVAAIWLLRRWSWQGEFDVEEKEVSNFIVLLAFFGVFLGGRLGYVLFYGFDSLLSDPLYMFKVWDGGMSSHGGFIGVILFMLWYARKHPARLTTEVTEAHSATLDKKASAGSVSSSAASGKTSRKNKKQTVSNGIKTFWNLADNMACVTSLGFFFGRLANFVNGELWGRVSNIRGAMVFPQELGYKFDDYDLPAIQAAMADGVLQPRHPSQLYQAFCEGLLVFLIMILLRRTAWAKRPGALSACYLALYAIARIGMEFFREPDSTIYFGWLTKGQLYSVLMVAAALVIAWRMNLFTGKERPADHAG